MDNIKKLVSFLGYMDKTLFERKYKRIVHLIRILIQISTIMALMHFWNPGNRYFTFKNIDMTPSLKIMPRF